MGKLKKATRKFAQQRLKGAVSHRKKGQPGAGARARAQGGRRPAASGE
jgi:hypothetical protein